MRVLLLHNRYREPGGEDAVASEEARLLERRGVEVRLEEVDNRSSGWIETLGMGLDSAWSEASSRRVGEICRRYRPQVVHVHNFWMRLTPAVHAAARAEGAATVQSLHNFRLVCANGLLLRQGSVCEDCLGRLPWRGVVRRCYRGSALASAAMVRMISTSRARGTWRRDVDAFIALSRHSREKFIDAGLEPERVFVKGNFLDAPEEPARRPSTSDVVLYAGRLAGEKGLDVLIEAWGAAGLGRFGRLLLAGEGPERQRLEARAAELRLGPEQVRFLGRQTPEQVCQLLGQARCAVLPSIWYEAFPRALVEAFAAGRAVVASRLGALAELVDDGRTGLTVPPGAPHEAVDGWSQALRAMLTHPALADRLGSNARAEYRRRHSPEPNFRRLMEIYRFAMAHRGVDWPQEPEEDDEMGVSGQAIGAGCGHQYDQLR